jgi:hypothetical protein
MNRFIKIIVPAFLVSLLCLSFSSDTHDKLYWDERNQLAWSDFKEVGTLRGNEVAHVNTGTEIHLISYKNNSAKYQIRAFICKSNTLVKKGKQNPHLLNHEQVHFDIRELYTRKLRKVFATQVFKEDSFENAFNQITTLKYKECIDYQELYDSETNHSKNKEKQEEWNKRIAKELEELEAYSNPVVHVTIR